MTDHRRPGSIGMFTTLLILALAGIATGISVHANFGGRGWWH